MKEKNNIVKEIEDFGELKEIIDELPESVMLNIFIGKEEEADEI